MNNFVKEEEEEEKLFSYGEKPFCFNFDINLKFKIK